jgi:hypothetical protein
MDTDPCPNCGDDGCPHCSFTGRASASREEISDAARIVYAIQSVPAGDRRLAALALASKLFIEDKIPERRRSRDPKLLALLVNVAEYDQTPEDAESELRADGVDVDAALARIHDAIASRPQQGDG